MKIEKIYSNFWEECAEENDPFALKTAYCSGYDVYEDILKHASWVEYLYLLLKKEKPTKQAAILLEKLAILAANPGPRDPSVHAGMCSGAVGSPAASAMMAALGVGAGQSSGAREVFNFMKFLEGKDFKSEVADVWPEHEEQPGFNQHGVSCPQSVVESLKYLSPFGEKLSWLHHERAALEEQFNAPLSMVAVISAGFVDLGLSPEQGEILYLFLRLPGVMAHSLEQKKRGFRMFPFFHEGVKL
jgi:citrate synthase